jgi:hypothetical protein
VAATARYPGLATKTGTKATDTQALGVIKTSLGLIMPPQDRKIGTWWSYRHIQALNTETPVVTYWQDTVGFDQSWGLLAYQVEDSDTFARQQIASEQLISYRNNIPSRDEVLNKLESIVLDLSKERI